MPANLTNIPYLGDAAPELFWELYNASPTFGEQMGGPHVKVFDTVKNTTNIPDFSFSNIITADSCEFDDHAELIGNNVELTVCNLKTNLNLCLEDFEIYYNQSVWGQPDGALNTTIQDPIQNTMYLAFGASIREFIERLTWQGNTGSSDPEINLCDGFITRIEADPDVITTDPNGDPLTPPAPIDVGNIMEELARIYSSVPSEVQTSHDSSTLPMGVLRFFIPYSWYNILKQVWATSQSNYPVLQWNETPTGNVLMYMPANAPIIPTFGLTGDQVVAAPMETLLWGTDLVSDFERFNMIDLRNTTGDFAYRFILRYRIGTQIRRGNYIVYYS